MKYNPSCFSNIHLCDKTVVNFVVLCYIGITKLLHLCHIQDMKIMYIDCAGKHWDWILNKGTMKANENLLNE